MYAETAGARPASILIDHQINRHYAFGSEDGGYRKPEEFFDRGSADDPPDSEDLNGDVVFDTNDLLMQTVPWELNPAVMEEDNQNPTYFDHEDWDFSGGTFQQGGDLAAVQSSVLAITIVRPVMVSKDENDEPIPHWKRISEKMHFQANDTDDNLNGIEDSQETGSDEDVRELEVHTIPSTETIDGILGTSMIADVKIEADESQSEMRFWQDEGRSESFTEFVGFLDDTKLFVEMLEPNLGYKLYAKLRMQVSGFDVEGSATVENQPDLDNGMIVKVQSIGLDVRQVPKILYASAKFATTIEYAFEGVDFDLQDNHIYNRVIDVQLLNYDVGGSPRLLASATLNPDAPAARITAIFYPSGGGPGGAGPFTFGPGPNNGLSDRYFAFVPSQTFRSSSIPDATFALPAFQVSAGWSRDSDGSPATALRAKSSFDDPRARPHLFTKGIIHGIDMGRPADILIPSPGPQTETVVAPQGRLNPFHGDVSTGYLCTSNDLREERNAPLSYEGAFQSHTDLDNGPRDVLAIYTLLEDSSGPNFTSLCESWVNRVSGVRTGIRFAFSYPGIPKVQGSTTSHVNESVLEFDEFAMDLYASKVGIAEFSWLGDQANSSKLSATIVSPSGNHALAQPSAYGAGLNILAGVAGVILSGPWGALVVGSLLLADYVLDVIDTNDVGPTGSASAQVLATLFKVREDWMPGSFGAESTSASLLTHYLGVSDMPFTAQPANVNEHSACFVGEEWHAVLELNAGCHVDLRNPPQTASAVITLDAPWIYQAQVSVSHQ